MIHVVKKPNNGILNDIVKTAKAALPYYQAVGMISSPCCQDCGSRRIFVLGFDICFRCRHHY
jgi:hypothetical protein